MTHDTITAAANHSRMYNEIARAVAEDYDAALDELLGLVKDGEESDYVRNGDVLEFWCYDPDAQSDEMTMRVHVTIAA